MRGGNLKSNSVGMRGKEEEERSDPRRPAEPEPERPLDEPFSPPPAAGGAMAACKVATQRWCSSARCSQACRPC